MMDNEKLAAYVRIQRTTSPPRDLEALALTHGANKLRECRDNWESDKRKDMLGNALRFNQRLWTIFQGAVGRSDSPLPKSLRLNLLRLSAYVDRQIFSIMARPSPEKLTPLIKINLGIAQGLRTKADHASAETRRMEMEQEQALD